VIKEPFGQPFMPIKTNQSSLRVYGPLDDVGQDKLPWAVIAAADASLPSDPNEVADAQLAAFECDLESFSSILDVEQCS